MTFRNWCGNMVHVSNSYIVCFGYSWLSSLPFSPTVRLSNSTTASSKFKGHPISATTPSDAPQNVYPTQRPPSANQRKTPPSRTGAVNHSMKIKRGTVKKDSTDESSSDDTDDSSDTN